MHKLVPLRLGDPENPIRVEFFLAKPPPTRDGNVLVMKFSGVYRVGCQGNPDAAFICAMQSAAAEYWDPEGTVLDLRDLDYCWGDMMDMVRGSPLSRGRRSAHAVVVGDKSRRAMATLIFGIETTQTVTDEPGYFDDDLDAALAYVFDRLPRDKTDAMHLRPPTNWPPNDADAAVTDEAKWLASNDPAALLRWAVWRVPPPTSEQWREAAQAEREVSDWSTITPAVERRMLLCTVACLRRIEPAMTDPRTRQAVAVAERLADGAATTAEFAEAIEAAQAAYAEIYRREPDSASSLQTPSGHRRSRDAALAAVYLDWPEYALREVVSARPRLLQARERDVQADLIRDIFGNPFRPPPTLDARHRNDEVVRLARAIYDERTFARLADLAAALERAGCADQQILDHLRSPTPHARGCHILDLILYTS